MSATTNLAPTVEFYARRFLAVTAELDAARGQLAAVEAALLMGGQSAEIRCRAALAVLTGQATP